MRYFKLIDWENFRANWRKKMFTTYNSFSLPLFVIYGFCLLFGSFYSGHTIRREK